MFVESVGVLGGDEIHGFEGWEAEVWGLALDELNEDDSCGPDVYEFIIKVLVNELGGHPCWSAYN